MTEKSKKSQRHEIIALLISNNTTAKTPSFRDSYATKTQTKMRFNNKFGSMK
ncbi:hypothetical protein [uncultured Photobacterium sp.]|uniref:hypothetical protein n=1 Tax=uncultured Photobacterium sp. TaxID=173973 RepID=UPI00262A0F40|nr:hypothetical protein [uncultured Photobacterium sp.]